jgi:hypothetical protein
MPRKGYKSITVTEKVYDYFYQEYSKVKEEYAIKKGIRSFSAYVTSRLSELLDLCEPPPRLVMRNHDDRGVKVWDEELKEHAQIQFTPEGIIYCILCDAHNCEHIRFALAQTDIRQLLKKKGWKLPDV